MTWADLGGVELQRQLFLWLLALQAAKKPQAAYKRVQADDNADAHVMLLTRRFRNSCRSEPAQFTDS